MSATYETVSLDEILDLDKNAMTDLEVARLTRPQRAERVQRLKRESYDILWHAENKLIVEQNRECVATVILFSGGNDSTTLAHLFKDISTHAAHANTGIGIEQTRQFVRNTCRDWGLPLLERSAPYERDTYRHHVLTYGFPGPGAHYKMFQRLKERALEQVRRELVKHPYRERVIFIAGRRRQESDRRANIPELQRKGSTVWVSPLINWTKVDLNTYRLMAGDVPVNEVSDLIHMSGECLCGCFAHQGEREEVGSWFPEFEQTIAELEALIAGRDDIPDYRKKWGWGADPETLKRSRTKPSKVGLLCSSCDARHLGGEAVAV